MIINLCNALDRKPAKRIIFLSSTAVYGDDYDTIDGTCIRDYIHVNDLSDAHLKALTYIVDKRGNLCVNLGTGNGYSVLEAIKCAESIVGKKINYILSDRRSGDPISLFAESSLANKLLDWQPKYSSLEIIMQTMWNLYNKESNAIH